MLRLITLLVAAAFLFWGTPLVMAGHGDTVMECGGACIDCDTVDHAGQGHGAICAACPVVATAVSNPFLMPVRVLWRGLPAVPGRLPVAEPALVSDPPPPRA